MEVIKIEHITKSFGKKAVLKDLSLEIKSASAVGLLGGNGCGKSTLLGILAGVIPCREGRFMFKGHDLLRERRLSGKTVGYVPQSEALFPELTAKDNLLFWYDRVDMERQLSEGVLRTLGIDGFLNTAVYKLSGGMKKRLEIGCAMHGDPDILLLDEPSAALDLPCKESIREYLAGFRAGGGTVMIATHDEMEIAFCDELYILRDGRPVRYDFDGDYHRLAEEL